MSHTAECEAQAERQTERIAAYEDRWPMHCRRCNATGHRAKKDGPYAGEDGPCRCAEEGICPRCGGHTVEEFTGEGPCVNCRWNGGEGECRPNPPECICPVGASGDLDFDPFIN